ncbi:MAG: DPP IV N-terminal domain-containing protein, partial [Gemmatimonadales bacterium]
VQYPKAGGTNSAGRVGVVSATGGETRWINIPGDPRNNYIARMEWAPKEGRGAGSKELVIQHMNPLRPARSAPCSPKPTAPGLSNSMRCVF